MGRFFCLKTGWGVSDTECTVCNRMQEKGAFEGSCRNI